MVLIRLQMSEDRNREAVEKSKSMSKSRTLFAMLCPVFSQVAIVALLFLLWCGPVAGEELLVPDDYFTIGEALEMAQEGDVVIVYPGVYPERISMKEGVELVSYAGEDGDDLVNGPGEKKVLRRALRTIIDGAEIEEPGYLMSFPQDTDAPMRVDGFTFRTMPKYDSSTHLFLMEIRGCSPVVENNILHGNKSWGAILSTGLGVGMGPALETMAMPVIRNNVIYDNFAVGIGNGGNSAAQILDNEIFDTTYRDASGGDRVAPAIGVREGARPHIEGNICYGNGSGIGAINFDTADRPLVIRNNTLYRNRSAGIGLRGIGSGTADLKVIIDHNTIYGNLAAGIRLTKINRVELRENDIHGNRRAGISLWDVTHAIIENNRVYANLATGIRLLDVTGALVRRNLIYRNVTAGIDYIGWQR